MVCDRCWPHLLPYRTFLWPKVDSTLFGNPREPYMIKISLAFAGGCKRNASTSSIYSLEKAVNIGAIWQNIVNSLKLFYFEEFVTSFHDDFQGLPPSLPIVDGVRQAGLRLGSASIQFLSPPRR